MAAKKMPDPQVTRIRKVLESDYGVHHPKARIDVYRYNPASIRVRIIDPDFKEKDWVDRDDAMWRILERVPEETRAEINLLLLLTPAETKKSVANMEFEDPTPARL